MDTPDIKAGTYYNLKLLCVLSKDKLIAFETPSGRYMPMRQCDLECVSPITPSEPPTSVGTSPKYDPCRKFRKGDIVEPAEINGRLPQELRGCYRYEVIVGEGEMTNPLYVALKPLLEANYKHLSEIHVNVAFLKLATPVEEKVPYSVRHSEAHAAYSIYGPYGLSAVNYFYGDRYPYSKHSAEAAAYAECDRLNAEYRKEQE